MYNNMEMSLVLFMPNVTTNHAIPYSSIIFFLNVPDVCGNQLMKFDGTITPNFAFMFKVISRH